MGSEEEIDETLEEVWEVKSMTHFPKRVMIYIQGHWRTDQAKQLGRKGAREIDWGHVAEVLGFL